MHLNYNSYGKKYKQLLIVTHNKKLWNTEKAKNMLQNTRQYAILSAEKRQKEEWGEQMNINQLRQFSCVAGHKSMTKASKELFVSQQALSKTIQLMQKEMGGELFTRGSRGLELTDLGAKLLTISESLLPRYDSCMEMIERLAEQNRNKLTLSFENVFYQYAIPAELLDEKGIALSIADGVESCMEAVRSGHADLGLCSRVERMEGLEFLPVLREPLSFLMNRNHPLARRPYLLLSDLRDVPQNLPSAPSVIVSRYIDACIEEGFYPNFVMESRDYGILLRSLRNSDHVLLCGSFAFNPKLDEDLVLLPLRNPALHTDVGFVIRQGNANPRALRFAGAVREHYGE